MTNNCHPNTWTVTDSPQTYFPKKRKFPKNKSFLYERNLTAVKWSFMTILAIFAFIGLHFWKFLKIVVKYFPKILYLTVTVQDDKLLPSDYLNGIFSWKNVLVKMAKKCTFFENFRFFGNKSGSAFHLTDTVHGGQNYHGAPSVAFSEKTITSVKMA